MVRNRFPNVLRAGLALFLVAGAVMAQPLRAEVLDPIVILPPPTLVYEVVVEVEGKTAVDDVVTVTSGERVTLTSTNSRLPEIPLLYRWTSDNPIVTLSPDDGADVSFVAPEVTEPTDATVTLTLGAAMPGPLGPLAVAPAAALEPPMEEDGDSRPTDSITLRILPAGSTASDVAEDEVQDLLQTRSTLLITSQPELDDALLSGGTPDGTANLTVSSMGGQADLFSGFDQPVWLRLKGSWSTVDGAVGDYFLGAVGANLMSTESFAAGIMAQADHLKTVDGASVAEGTGWMAGPYAVVRLKDRPITVQGRLLYGATDNSLSPLGTYEDGFGGQRMLAMLGVTGEVKRGEMVLKPTLSAAYVRETTEAYVNGAGAAIAAQESAVAQVAPGVEVSFPVQVASGSLRVNLGLSDVWSGSVAGPAFSYEGHRGRVSAGLSRVFGAGSALSATAAYDGIGTPTYENLSVDLLFEHKF